MPKLKHFEGARRRRRGPRVLAPCGQKSAWRVAPALVRDAGLAGEPGHRADAVADREGVLLEGRRGEHEAAVFVHPADDDVILVAGDAPNALRDLHASRRAGGNYADPYGIQLDVRGLVGLPAEELRECGEPGGSVSGERANLKGLVLGCIDPKYCK